MIPKIIHYCWFGKKPIPDQLKRIMDSWSRFCPDYEIKVWNEDTFDVSANQFTKTAYEHKKFAFVSDYVRAYALFHYGGVYLDTDVELKANIDHLLLHDAFSGFEKTTLPFTAVWGSRPKHSLSESILAYYQNRNYQENEAPNTNFVSDMICTNYGIDPLKDEYQVGTDGKHQMHIYPSTYLCLDLPANVATHHFVGSWLPQDKRGKK